MGTAIDSAMQLVEEAARDPLAAVSHPAKILTLLQRAKRESAGAAPGPSQASERLARVLERLEEVVSQSAQPLAALGCTHIVRVEDAPALTPGGKESTMLKVDWPGGAGLCRSMFAGTLDGDPASLSRVSVRIAINGSDDLFTTGSAPAFVPLLAFQAGNHNWFRLQDYAVSAAQKWAIHFKYEGPVGPPTITPYLLFGFKRERE